MGIVFKTAPYLTTAPGHFTEDLVEQWPGKNRSQLRHLQNSETKLN
jgi:hypothetical protein